MTADKTMETNGQDQDQAATKGTGRKRGRRRSATRTVSVKRSRTATSRPSGASRVSGRGQGGRTARSAESEGHGSGATRSRRRSKASRSAESSAGGGIASRFLSRGRRAAGNAYGWATEGTSRAMPLASRLPDQRMVQRFVDERPYMLGALGLGIGAMIGLMLPSPLSMRAGGAVRGRGRGRH